MPDLLFEIGTEEIPASYIRPALSQLGTRFKAGLDDTRLSAADVRTYATPRRLVLVAAGLPSTQPDAEVEVTGPPAKVAFDAEGKPTRAAEGFAKAQGVAVEALEVRETPKGKYCCAVKREPGRPTAELLAGSLPMHAASLSFPKSMIWKSGIGAFARPVRWVVALLDAEVVKFELLGVESGRVTYGHPFLAPGPVELKTSDFEPYQTVLREHKVIVDPDERRESICSQVLQALESFGGPMREADLLKEVTNLVEFPHVVIGEFDEQFLKAPAEIIETAMIHHQSYFPVRDCDENLLAKFLVVTNRGPEQAETTRAGNEHVLRARLADAKFFWEQDRKRPLADRVPELSQISFLRGLGTYAEKAERLVRLAGSVAEKLGLEGEQKAHAERAARLCKADLLTQTVGEFANLQGVAGALLAAADGEAPEVAGAIRQHYQPRHAGDDLPASEVAIAVSLAEKIDNIAGCFVLGLTPTGSQDPYALRRQTHGLIRMVEHSGKHFSVADVFAEAQGLMPTRPDDPHEARAQMLGFLRDRLFTLWLDRGHPHDLINAALAAGFDDLVDFTARLALLNELAALPEWPDLVTVVERTYNIGKKAGAEGPPSEDLLAESEERKLWQVFADNREEIGARIERREYREAALLYAHVFGEPVHRFFEKVFVNVEDEALRNNRLRLLRAINELFSTRIADLSEIVTGV